MWHCSPARLEQQTKLYGVDIVVGEDTLDQADDFVVLELDRIQVRGRKQTTRIYTILEDGGEVSDAGVLVATHRRMLTAYRSQDWKLTRALLEECMTLGLGRNLDQVYRLYGDRIVELEKNPPAPGWDGVHAADGV